MYFSVLSLIHFASFDTWSMHRKTLFSLFPQLVTKFYLYTCSVSQPTGIVTLVDSVRVIRDAENT